MNNEPSLIAAETARAAAKTAAPCASQFLEEQMRITQRAMADTITDLKDAAIYSLNPRPWFRHHPAVCISVLVAGAGIVSAAIYRKVHKGKTEQTGKRRRSKPRVEAHIEIDAEQQKTSWKKQAGSFLASNLFQIIRKALINAVMARYVVTRIEPGEYSEGNAPTIEDLLAEQTLRATENAGAA
jgi:hypothetical protein